jgi:hypothetical protein
MGAMRVQVERWGEHGPRPEPDHGLDALFGTMTVTVELAVPCSVAQAWALASDVERIGEFSPECVEARWVAGYPAAAVRGRFEGRNRVVEGDDAYDWIRICEVVVFDPPREFAWTVGDRFDGTRASRWAFKIVPQVTGCLIRQEFRHYPDGLSGLRLFAQAHPSRAAQLIAARQHDLSDGMTATLQRMSAVLTTRQETSG